MKVIIVGCGKIGTAIIDSLVAEGHNVVAVEIKSEVISALTNVYDIMCVCGSGTDCDALSNAGTADADIFVSVTNSDEINMLSCFMAKKMGAKYTVARIRNPEIRENRLAFLKQHLDISYVINPEFLAAKEIFNILKLPSAIKIETFCRRKFEMIELSVKPDSLLDGISLIDLRKKCGGNFLVCAVSRGEQVFIPNGDFVLEAGDKIGVTAATTEIQQLLKSMGVLQKKARNIMLLGASRVSAYLTRMLIKSGNNVKVIDKQISRCEEFSKLFPEASVVLGDGAEQEVLLEEGIKQSDAFVSLTGMDEENIIVSCFAASSGVSKVVTKVNRPELGLMAKNMGLDTIISPKRLISDVIVRYARALENSKQSSNIETLYKLMNDKVEALEFIVGDDIKFSGTTLKELKFKKNIIVAGILRGRKSIIPSGEDTILPKDRVIVIAAGKNIQNLSDIIED